MFILGVVGGIGSGKSSVSQLLAKNGATILNADRIGHDVLRQMAVKEAVQRWFGDSVFDPTGEINRKELAKIVFSPTEKGKDDLAFLNDLTHSRIAEDCRKVLAELERQETKLVVLDAALLFESGWNELANAVIFVDVPESIRLERCEKRGWSRTEFLARESAQWSIEEKRQLADYILSNAGTPADLEKKVQEFHNNISFFHLETTGRLSQT